MASVEADVQTVSLATLGGGAAVERFDYEFERVLENIADIQTSPTAVREVTLKLKIKPNEERGFAVADIVITSKMAPIKPETTSMYLNGRGSATEWNPKQERFNFKREEK